MKKHVVPNSQQLNWQEIFEITKIFTTIIDSKSRFTGRHSTGIIKKTEIAADFYRLEADERTKMKIAASLHDLGKLGISEKILEKSGKLNSTEMEQMKAHTFYTKFALSQIDNFEDIKEWAANHHEKLNGKGYPEGLKAEELTFNCRLLACIDIFQALTEERPYRKGLDFQKTFEIMDKMRVENFLDNDIVRNFIPYLAKRIGMIS